MADKALVRDEGTMGLAAWTGRSSGMTTAHQHLDLEINYVLDGTMRYLVGGRIVELFPYRLCLLWGGVPHQMIRGGQPTEAIWVTVPLAAVLRWGLPDHLIRPLLATGFVADTNSRPRDRELLQQWTVDLGNSNKRRTTDIETSVQEIVFLEIEARLRRLARSMYELTSEETSAKDVGEQGVATAHIDRGLTAVEAMARFISRNFVSDIGVPEIAGAAHLHPNYAMTLFRQHTGMTIAHYLTLQRVAQAQRFLATTGDSISVIAMNSGFRSLSRFYEAFRQQTGNSPRRFRLRLKSARLPVRNE